MQAYSANQPSEHRSIAQSIASAAVGCGPSNARMPRSSSQTSAAAQHRPGKEKRGVVMLEPGARHGRTGRRADQAAAAGSVAERGREA